MKICLTCLLAMIALHIWGQGGNPRALGIGFAVADNPYQYENGGQPSRLFRDPALKVKWSGADVVPFFHKADYGLYHFICLDSTEAYYKVLANDNDIAYLPREGGFHFLSWDALLIGSSIELIEPNTAIYACPSDSKKLVPNPCKSQQLRVKLLVKLKGEYWAYVAMPLDCEHHADIHLTPCRLGWVKWRTAHELLVSILLLC